MLQDITGTQPIWRLDGRSLPAHTVGGKGASLSTLHALGAPIPAAAAIPTWVYREFAEANRIPPDLNGIATSTLPEIRGRILDAPLPLRLVGALRTIESSVPPVHGSPSHRLAVRSSAPAEDSARHAFAGLHDTILDVQPGDGVEKAVRQCWASLWSERAVAYRHEHRLHHLPMDIAVVLQALVRCDVSFVAFAVDPISGSEESVVITSTWGLGESIVSGLVVPDTIHVDRHGAISDYRIGSKEQMVISRQDGVRTVPVPRLLQHQQSLTPEDATRIAGLVRSLSGRLGFPADVEGGLAQGQLYLFQARPITTVTTTEAPFNPSPFHRERDPHGQADRLAAS